MNPFIHLFHYVTQAAHGLPRKRLSHVGEGGLCDINSLIVPADTLLGGLQGLNFMSHKVETDRGGGGFGDFAERLAGARGRASRHDQNFFRKFSGKTGMV